MKTQLLAAAAAISLAACAGAAPEPAATAAQTAAVGEAAAGPVEPAAAPGPQIGDFGFDVAGMDTAVAPGNSFYEYANGKWQDITDIPADRSNFGMFVVLEDLSNERTREIVEAAAKAGAAANAEQRKVGDYYSAFMDEAAVEARGLAPVKPLLAEIDAIKDRKDLAVVLAKLERLGVNEPVGLFVNQDAKAPDTYVPILYQSGLGLPDRDYYLEESPKFAEARTAYQNHIEKMLSLAGIADAAAKAKAIYDLEYQMAKAHWSRIESRDDDKTYNPWSQADFTAKAPGFDWATWFDGAGLGSQDKLIVAQPSAFVAKAKLLGSAPVDTWKAYLTYHTLSAFAPVLPKAFVDEDFALNGTVLSGTPQIRERWKRGVEQVTNALGEAVGKLYVAEYFPPEAKAAADKLVGNVIAAMDARLQKLEWMTPETKAKARAKLASFTPKIGYPDKWRDYSALEVSADDAFGNYLRANAFEYQRNIDKLGKPVDRGEWFMTPMTINAYANPTMNEVVFPAAILQPPFFDPHADPAINYGGIGAVIGHEISHHFDDQGRKYDASGQLTDWWTPEDVTRFKTYTDRLVAQYDAYEPLPGMHVKGGLTLGENIADLAGLTVAHDAYLRSLGGEAPPVLDGLTGDQRFYLGWAQVWRRKYREENLRQRLVSDPHSPSEQRVAVVRNLDPWYSAFDVNPGETLYLTPEQRVRIW